MASDEGQRVACGQAEELRFDVAPETVAARQAHRHADQRQHHHLLQHHLSTVRRSAPRATRMPISRVRNETA